LENQVMEEVMKALDFMTDRRVLLVRTTCECGRGYSHSPIQVLWPDAETCRTGDYIVVADSCPYGPDANNELIIRGPGYGLYSTFHTPAP
jgi:hypothetical protein